MLNFSPNTKKLYSKTLWLTVVLFVGAIFFGLLFFKSCTSSGIEAKEKVYQPNQNTGFVKKINGLLDYLLHVDEESTANIMVRTLDDLNRKYPALVFSIPSHAKGELNTSFMHTSDIRLIDVNVDKIEDEEMRKLYYNCSLQFILDKQRNNNDLNYFSIKFTSENDSLKIKSVELIASLFRQPLEKCLWTGTIMASDGNLFPRNEYCFLSWGTNILPIRHTNATSPKEYVLSAYLSDNHFTKNNQRLELVDISRDNENNLYKQIVLSIYEKHNSNSRVGTINLKYLDNETIEIKTDQNLVCEANLMGKQQILVKPSSASAKALPVEFTNDIKLVFYRNGTPLVKIAEMVLTHENPALLLSGVTKTNAGLSRYIIDKNQTDRFTQQVIRGASGMLTDLNITDTVTLTLNPFFSRWLENEMKDYVNITRREIRRQGIGRKDDRWEMSVTVVDMATGNVLAMPYYRSEDENIPYTLSLTRKNPALTRRYIGSIFKPLITLAAVLTKNDLVNIRNNNGNLYSRNFADAPDDIANMLGQPIIRWAHDQWGTRSGIIDFLARSCDVFPVALTLLALDPGRNNTLGGNIFYTPRNGNNLIYYNEEQNKFHWNNLPLLDTLNRLYSVKSFSVSEDGENSTESRYMWRNIHDRWDTLDDEKTQSVELVSPDVTVMRYDAFNKAPYSVRANIVPWVLGQGSNEWNALKIAEAWSRMLTRRNIKVSMVMPHESINTETISSNRTIWNRFLSQLDSAQSVSPNLLTPMKRAIDALNNRTGRTDGTELMLFSKTGTPDNYDRQEFLNVKNATLQYDMGLYCLGIMTRNSYNAIRNGRNGGGIMCVVRITRISSKKDDGNGLDSKYARNFFSNNSGRLDRFYWFTRTYYL